MPKTVKKVSKAPSTPAAADKNLLGLAAIVVIVSATAFFLLQGQKSTTPTTNQITVNLSAQNGSGQSGTATLVETNGKSVTVTFNLTGAPKDISQPAHIHMGTCAKLGAIKYPLTNVINGKSTTTLDVNFGQLKSDLPLAINVHKSTIQSNVYVSCANLTLDSK